MEWLGWGKWSGGPSAKADDLSSPTLTGAEGATSIKDEIVARVPQLNNSSTYRKARYMLTTELGGAAAVGEELTFSGFINTATQTLTIDEKPFNIFARLASTIQVQPGMEKEQLALGTYKDKYLICRNKAEHDLYWDTTDPAWISKVSMSRRHRFLTTKNLHWEWFNALVFGLVPPDMGGVGLAKALQEVESMKAAALTYVSNSTGWSKSIGLFFNVFGHNNVNSLFLHILDLTCVGPSFEYQSHKNCPLDAVLKVLKEEAELHAETTSTQAPAANIKPSPPSPTRRQSVGGSAFFFAGTDGATSVKAELVGRVPILKDASSFREARRLLQEELGGFEALKEELSRAGLIDRSTGLLTTGTRPFNVFARIAGGAMKQPGMDVEQEHLGPYGEKFMICSNLPENDDHWDSEDPAWIGKASMSKKHRFLTCRNLHWSWFNALVFGIIPEEEGGCDVSTAVKEVEEMIAAALHYTSSSEGWSKSVGLFFHVFGHCSVNSLHMHILDMEEVGPTYRKLKYKNCPVDAVLKVLKEEEAASPSSLLKGVAESAKAAAQAAQAATMAVNMVVGPAASISNQKPGQQPILVTESCRVSEIEERCDVMDLNVGGVHITVERQTLLAAPEGSLPNTLARLGDKAPVKRDLHGMIFLEYPPGPFQRIIDHLRILRYVPDGHRSASPAPPGHETREVLELAEIMGLSVLFKGLRRGRGTRCFSARRCLALVS